MEPTIPGPPNGFAGLSNAWRIRGDPLAFLQSLARDHGEMAAFQLGSYRAVFINHPDLVREVLVTQQKIFPKLGRQRKTIRLLDGDNMFIKQGPAWLRQRRLVQTGFHPSRMQSYASVIIDHTNRRMSQWKLNTPIDFSDEMIDLAISIITRTMFGFEPDGKLSAALRRLVYFRSRLFLKEMGAAIRLPDWLPIPSKIRKRWVIRKTDELICPEIRNRRQSGQYRDDMLSALMTAVDDDGQKMTDQEVRDEAALLFHAGLDDIASALTWMFYLLATHEDIQERLQQEVVDIVQDREPVVEELAKMELADAIARETLRLYPSTWIFTARETLEDTRLGGFPIRRKTWVFISPMVTHRDRKFFGDPDAFRPDRFLNAAEEKITRDSWFPFGMGPRVCLGSAFAMMEMKLIAAMVVRKFRIQLVPGQKPVEPCAQVTVRPKRGVKILLLPR